MTESLSVRLWVTWLLPKHFLPTDPPPARPVRANPPGTNNIQDKKEKKREKKRRVLLYSFNNLLIACCAKNFAMVLNSHGNGRTSNGQSAQNFKQSQSSVRSSWVFGAVDANVVNVPNEMPPFISFLPSPNATTRYQMSALRYTTIRHTIATGDAYNDVNNCLQTRTTRCLVQIYSWHIPCVQGANNCSSFSK